MKQSSAIYALAVVMAIIAAPQAEPLPTPSQRFGGEANAEVASFRKHVIPLLGVRGCNGRECHGSFSGKGGFQLSLFGYEFDKDHEEIVHDEGEIRVNRDQPENSLILMKPTMQEKHKGKLRFEKDSWEYRLLLSWIKDGAKNDSKLTPEFERLEIVPASLRFTESGQWQRLQAIVHWTDGSIEDVTELTRFRSNDESIVTRP